MNSDYIDCAHPSYMLFCRYIDCFDDNKLMFIICKKCGKIIATVSLNSFGKDQTKNLERVINGKRIEGIRY